MANVKVAVRVRPLSKRENAEGRSIIVEVEDRVATVRNIKVDNRYESLWDTREKTVEFGFDYCYWSVDPEDPKYASQEVVFQDLGTSILSGAFKGYNICLFAYGQTGSGKTYTMMGTPTCVGLTPRICEGLFSREDDYSKQSASCRVEVSFLEIYNERVRDLLRQSDHKKPYTLRVREHPVIGPYVQGLSQHVVTDYRQVVGLLEEGIANRITAATHVHDASSRSHAIFTIQYTQALLEDNLPSEIASKINLVDLAGSERADPSYCKDRITEGGNINKSLVTLGIVISTLAQNSKMFSSCQSINSIASEVDSNHADNHCGAHISSHRRQAYIPYRDSVLTWLLKDSLGGNSKTIMIATISPASSCYNETMSTLRYASNAKNIINKPRINEDANVKLIRELREEIDRLKAMLMSFELRNSSPSWSDDKEGNLTELVLQNEVKIEQLTKDWTDKWINRKAIMEEYSVDINKNKAGVVIDSNLPHLMAMDYDILSTGVVLYHLREGTTKIGRSDSNQEQDIVLQGKRIEKDHCVVENQHGIVTLRPLQGAHCIVNGHEVTDSVRLSQGALIILGQIHKFRFNHPAEAAILRQRRLINETSSVVSCRSLDWLDLDGGFPSYSYDIYPAKTESSGRRPDVSEECQPKFKKQEVLQRREVQQQQLYVKELQQQILDGELRAEQELEHDQAVIDQQIRENQQWLINEKNRLAAQKQQESAVQTEIKSYVETGVQNILESEISPSLTEQNKKKLVQLELLRKYSLKKAERHLSRKKVKLHLERIVKKQKLLEAQKILEQLEATCWITEDNVKCPPLLNQDIIASSWDCKYSQPGSTSGSLKCRQNISSDVQPLHCSLLPERDLSQLTTSEHNYECSKVSPLRKSLSVEYFNRTLNDLSENDNIHVESDGSFPNQRQLNENEKLYWRNKVIGEISNSSDTEVIFYICKDNQTMEKSSNRPRQTRLKPQILKSGSPDHFKKKYESDTVKQVAKTKASGDSNQHAEKHLEKNEPQEAGRRIRAEKGKKHRSLLPGNSMKELKKPAVCSKPPVQHLNQKAKKQKSLSENIQSVEQHQHQKTTSLTRSLSNISNRAPLCRDEKQWCSVKTQSAGISKAVPGLLRNWQEGGDVEFSDTDSNYSVDSLSCDNAKVPTEPLNHEESAELDTVNLDDSESDDSQMSQDSLTEKVNKIECQNNIKYFSEDHQESVKVCKDSKYHPLSLITNTSVSDNNLTVNERSFSFDSLGDADEEGGESFAEESKFQSCDEIPAEVFWKLQNLNSASVKSSKQYNPETTNEKMRITDDVTLNTSSFYLDANAHSSFNNIHDQPVKEIKISFCEQEDSLEERSHIAGQNVPALPVPRLSCDLKNAEINPVIAMPSSLDHTELQIAPVHSVKSNCWIKKDDLRQSAAEISFVSCHKTSHWPSCEPNKNKMLFSSVEPSLPLPETRKQFETESPGATSSFSLPTFPFPTKYSYCEVSSLKSAHQEHDDLIEGGSTAECSQTSVCLKEPSGTDSLSQVSEKLGLSVSSVYPEISEDPNLEYNLISVINAPVECINTNFEECLFRTIEKGDADCDSDTSKRDSKVIELKTSDKSISMLPVQLLDLTSLDFSPEENYQGTKKLFSKEEITLFHDDSYYLHDKSVDSDTNVGGKYFDNKTYFLRCGGNNFDVMQKTRCHQVSSEEIAMENKLYNTKSTVFHCSDQFALPVHKSGIDSGGVQGSRDVLTESALEVPSFREAEEEQAQNEEWHSENDFEFQTKALLNDSQSSLDAGFSGSNLHQKKLLGVNGGDMAEKDPEGENYNMPPFSYKGKLSLTGMDLVTDKSVYSEIYIKGEKNLLNCSHEIVGKYTSQPDSLTERKIAENLILEERKGDYKQNTINSKELTKLINSVNKLECDILEMKCIQHKCLYNNLAAETQSLNAEGIRNSRSCNVIQMPDSDHEKCYKKLQEKVAYKEAEIWSIDDSKIEQNALRPAIELSGYISINNNKIEGSTEENDCFADIEASPNSVVPAICIRSSFLTENTVDLLDTNAEHVQIEKTIESSLCSESTVNTIATEYSQENILNYIEKDGKKSTNNENSILENLIMYPKRAEDEKIDGSIEQNDAAKDQQFMNSELTDRSVALLQNVPAHGFMNCDTGNSRANLDSTETGVSVSNLEDQKDVSQLLEVCLDENKTNEEKRSADLWRHMHVLEESLKNVSYNGSLDNGRAAKGHYGNVEEFEHINNVESVNVSTFLSSDYSADHMSEHSDVRIVGERLDNCIPKQRATIHAAPPTQLAVNEALAQNIGEQNTHSFQTENTTGHLEENRGNPKVPENRDSSWSNSETLLHKVSKEMECVPHIFSRNNSDAVDDSVPLNEIDPPEITNEDYELSSVAIISFSHQPANSPLLTSVNANGENMVGDSSITSSIAMSLSNSAITEVPLQYQETEMVRCMQAGILYPTNKGEINDPLSDAIIQNKCIQFSSDQLQQNGEQNSLVQYNQIDKCLETECIETEYKTNDETFTRKRNCKKETAETLVCRLSPDLNVGHSVDSGAVPLDGINVLGYANQALWENTHHSGDIASGCNVNSYTSESSTSYLNSSVMCPNFLLEHSMDKYKTNTVCFDKSEYLDSEVFDVPVSTAESYAVQQQENNITSLTDDKEIIQGLEEMHQDKIQGQDDCLDCPHELEEYMSSQSENAVNRMEIGFQKGNLLSDPGLKPTSSDETTPSVLYCAAGSSTCTVFKNAGTFQSPESAPLISKSIAACKQDTFLGSRLSAPFQVQEDQLVFHQAFPFIPSSSPEAFPVFTLSHSQNEEHGASSTSSCSVLATSQMQESNPGDSEMHNQQLCASQTSSLSFGEENRFLPLSETNSHVDCSGMLAFTSEKIYHRANVSQEPSDTASLQKCDSENSGKTLFPTLNSDLDLQGDRVMPQLNNRLPIVSVTTTNKDNNNVIICKVAKSRNESFSLEQLNIPLINEGVSSTYSSGNSCSTLQEKSAKELLRNKSKVFISLNTNRRKQSGQRPALQSHSLSAPTIVIMSNSECASEPSKLDVTAHHASKSLEELNLSVEPPSPTEDDLHKIESLSQSKVDSVAPIKYKARFKKKAFQTQSSDPCDKRRVKEEVQGDYVSSSSPAHCPVVVAQITDHSPDKETERCISSVTAMHGYNMSRNEKVEYQIESTSQLVQDNKDSMHFSSSDINPYVHPWQQDERCKIGWKQFVFGSASDVSNKPHPLSLDNPTVVRCYSVDNDLNSQNSPFHSHLSSYANARKLSSTISSTDDLQGWDVTREGFESTHPDESGKHYSNVSHEELESKPENANSSCENILPDRGCSQQSGNMSVQVDEIVLLYPSESDTLSPKQQTVLTCEQQTQTDTPGKHKRKKRHRRSYTDMSGRKSEASENSFQQPSSWSSVQNLSLHLSQLLHNTSELLGNLSLQTIQDNERTCHKAVEESIKPTVFDSSTQTIEDIGIQTEILGDSQNKIRGSQFSTNGEGEPMKSQEVNVIVRLVHSDSVTLTKETMAESKQILQSMPNIRSLDADAQGDSYDSQPTLNKNSYSVPEVQKIQLNTPPDFGFSNMKISDVSSSFGSRPDSSTAIVHDPASTFCQSLASYSQARQPVPKISIAETRGISSKNRLLVDRASSPILTLSASTIRQHARSDKSVCCFKGYSGQPKGNCNSEISFRKRGSDPYDLNSWEQLVDTSSQTEVDSESVASRESKEMCKMATNGEDENIPQKPSEIGVSTQKHRFNIDTHPPVHNRRLYHSSSTLELSNHGEYLLDDAIPVECSFPKRQETRRARNFSGGMKHDSSIRNCDYTLAKKYFQESSNKFSMPSLKSVEIPLDSFPTPCHLTWRSQNCRPFPVSEMSNMQDNADGDADTLSDTESECNTEILLNENTSFMKKHRVRSYSLRDLPLHNKFSNWCGVKGGSRSSLAGMTQSASDIHSHSERKASDKRTADIEERNLFSERKAREIERLRRERAQIMSGIHLDMNQHPLTVELNEAKLTYGIGETDAQLRILQAGVGEDLTPVSIKQQLYERHRKSLEILRKQREQRLQCFRRSRSLSPQKHLSLLQTLDTNQRDVDLPSRRREYLQRLRRDVVENTRVQEPKMKIQHPSEIELLLQDYQKAREETKTEIARARDKLRERAEQEKKRIRGQILSQLQKEEAKLKTLVSTSTLCTDSTLSLSSGPTSGYNSSSTATYAASMFGKQEDQTSSEDTKYLREEARGRSVIKKHQIYVVEPKGSSSETCPVTSSSMEKSSMLSPLTSSHKCSHSLNGSPSTFPASPIKRYEDLSKHVLATATAEVMAMCSNDLKNLYSGWATAGWKYQCVEKDVFIYYKGFSSSATKHGFLGAGIIDRPLPNVLCMLKDPSKRRLYDKSIATAQVHKKITSNIDLVYVVSDASLCYQKQPRDFCCISVEAREENACILAIQSVYDESMPRPCKEMVRGEILPSAWILEPDKVNGRDITKVIYMIQVELGAPAIPAKLLSSVAKHQPLVIAQLAHLLG